MATYYYFLMIECKHMSKALISDWPIIKFDKC